jgi:hypothetical protein
MTAAYTVSSEVLAMHCYITDLQTGRARLLTSALTIDTHHDKKTLGRANRFLHDQDIEYFFKLGFKIYDLGGYAKDTNVEVLRGINSFKDSFGGELIEESTYRSKIARLARRV